MDASSAAGLVQVGIERDHPALGVLAAAIALPGERMPAVVRAARSPVVALATCHRLELYVEHGKPEDALAAFRAWVGTLGRAPAPIVRQGPAAARHLLCVAAGLASAVLGEDQVLAQVRAAYRDACAQRAAGPLLHRLFHASFRAGRRVRHETTLGAGTRSLAGAAVAALHARVGGLRGRAAAVYGAGETGALTARLLAGRGVARLAIASRTPAHAEALAREVGGYAVRWEWREGLLPAIDVLACAVRADRPVLAAAALRAAAAQRARALVIADLGMPPNVEPEPVEGVQVIDLEALAAFGRRDAQLRASAVDAASAIVDEELESWVAWSRSRDEYPGAVRAAGRG